VKGDGNRQLHESFPLFGLLVIFLTTKDMTTAMGSAILRAFLAAFAAICLAWGSVVWYNAMIMTQNPFAPIGNLHRKNELQVQHGGGLAVVAAGGAASRTVAHSYTHPAFAAANVSKGKLKPPPIRVMEQYMEWHSVEALRRDPHHRKFSVVFYSCPLQAGNRIHHFLASAYWSIVTNRTMLFHYWDRGTCYKYGSMYSHAICREANTVYDCDAILARAPWIPHLDDWRRALNLPRDPVELPFYATHPRQVFNHRFPWGPGNDDGARGVDVRYNSIPLVMFSQTRSKITFMDPNARKCSANVLLDSELSRRTNAQLHSLGVDFLFGMLQRYSFELTDAMYGAIPPDAMKIAQRDESRSAAGSEEGANYTIALHSRHIDESMDGCDVSREVSCVNELLERNAARRNPASTRSTPKTMLCAVAVMSDRSCTISAMSQWLRKRGCHVHVAHHDARIDYLSEHGPYAGAGFFQDVALATTVARSGFVGMRRSSSDVVLELLQFYRTMEAWERSDEVTPDLSHTLVDVCILSRIDPPVILPKTARVRANRTRQSP
jgi:hypothetical protein